MASEQEDTKPDIYINLKVMAQDNNEVHFKIKKTTPMKKLIDAYCKRQGVMKTDMRFMFDGNPLKDTDTPIELSMEDGDVIDVMKGQTGGSARMAAVWLL